MTEVLRRLFQLCFLRREINNRRRETPKRGTETTELSSHGETGAHGPDHREHFSSRVGWNCDRPAKQYHDNDDTNTTSKSNSNSRTEPTPTPTPTPFQARTDFSDSTSTPIPTTVVTISDPSALTVLDDLLRMLIAVAVGSVVLLIASRFFR